MKIPKSLKLPRKLKKEVKKGITNIDPDISVFSNSKNAGLAFIDDCFLKLITLKNEPIQFIFKVKPGDYIIIRNDHCIIDVASDIDMVNEIPSVGFNYARANLVKCIITNIDQQFFINEIICFEHDMDRNLSKNNYFQFNDINNVVTIYPFQVVRNIKIIPCKND
jgi:hypothetical protein